jgi:two-component system phosphate regulon sensor histidine kinase PhoR
LSAFIFAILAFFDQASWLTAFIGVFLTGLFAFRFAFAKPYNSIKDKNAPREKTPEEDGALIKLVEALPDPCLLLDKRGTVTIFNSKAAAWIPGLGKNDPLSFHLRWPALNEAIAQALNGKASSIDIEEKISIERWYTIFLSPLNLSNDKTGDKRNADHVDYVCVSIHDRTEQKRSERMRVDFVANASHELRTPLASLLGFVETLQGAARDDEKSREHFLLIMQLQAMRMSRLINDLLSLSRIEMHAHIQPETQLELAPLLQSTLDGLKPLAKDRGVTLSIQKLEEQLIVRGDRDELFRAFENLIENAIKYGEAGKKVEVDITPPKDKIDNMIRIAIRDFGPGIAEEHLPRLTERFYRVDEVSSREKGGTGLGLAIVKHILNRHRGSLEIESRLGQGSVFTALLPQEIMAPADSAST